MDLVSEPGLSASACAAGGGAALAAYLASSLPAWEAAGRSAAWLRVPLSRPSALGAAGAAGFEFHHAHGSEATLLKWLAPGPCKVPPYATHNVGVGGALVDAAGNLLVVRERRNGGGGPWKLPGGLSDAGEDLADAAVREVWEETGVRARFVALLAFRQTHGAAHGASDLYFVALLAPAQAGAVAPPLAPDPGEIAAAEWQDAAAFAAAASHPVNAFVARAALAEAQRRGLCAPRGAPAASAAAVATIDYSDTFIPIMKRWTRIFSAGAAGPLPPSLQPGDALPGGGGVVVPERPRPRAAPWEAEAAAAAAAAAAAPAVL